MSEPASSEGPPAASGSSRTRAIRHSLIRRRTAEHLRRSVDTSAHVYSSIEVDFEAVDAVRRVRAADWKQREGFGLSYLPFTARAAAQAIATFPEVNGTFTADALLVHADVHLGIAVDLDFKGLMVPVVRDVTSKKVPAIAREVHELARRARAKELAREDVVDGTFTITNPGPYGTLLTMPIINQPQVAILATDGVRRRPVAVTGADGSEDIVVHPVGNIVLTWDHRAFDGAYAAAFLNEIKERLETSDWDSEF
ncbi:MAG: 2-oxo acid dehydrogenase subunit E2 [Acidimicrobiales bacterium]|nr:2-oxo acid dehydrogenase subunit E2 [Acidimicrobiales bacterium]